MQCLFVVSERGRLLCIIGASMGATLRWGLSERLLTLGCLWWIGDQLMMISAHTIIIVPPCEIILSHHSWLLMDNIVVGVILLAASMVRFRSQVGLRDGHVLNKLADGWGRLVLEQLGGWVLGWFRSAWRASVRYWSRQVRLNGLQVGTPCRLLLLLLLLVLTMWLGAGSIPTHIQVARGGCESSCGLI